MAAGIGIRGPGIKMRLSPRSLAAMQRKLKRMKIGVLVNFPGRVEKIAEETLEAVVDRMPDERGSGILAGGWLIQTRRKGESFKMTVMHRDDRKKRARMILMSLEYGSAPRIIRAKNEFGALAFFKEGVWHIHKQVSHRGNRPYAFVRLSAAEAQVKMIKLLDDIRRASQAIWGGAA